MTTTKTGSKRILDQLRSEIDRSSVLLTSLEQTLTDMLARARTGDSAALRGLAGKHAELESAIRKARDIEERFHDWQRKTEAGDNGPDIEAIRAELGRRLDRLRRASETKDLPGSAE